MLIGQTIILPVGPEYTDYYGPWMPRGGNAFSATLEVMRESAAGWDFEAKVETKNAEDNDSAASQIGSLSRTTPCFDTQLISDCLELVRYHFKVRATTSQKWIHFRMNPPIWQPN